MTLLASVCEASICLRAMIIVAQTVPTPAAKRKNASNAGLPVIERIEPCREMPHLDRDHALALRSSTTLSPGLARTNDGHDASTGLRRPSIEVRNRSGSRCCRWRAPNGDPNVQPAKQHAHRHRAERPHQPTGNIPARSSA
jgi:hypothetical protein